MFSAMSAVPDSTLEEVADKVVSSVVANVPAYRRGFGEPGDVRVLHAVRSSTYVFWRKLVAPNDAATAASYDRALVAAYELGVLQAESGLPIAPLLHAYRIGSRTAWTELARLGADVGLSVDAIGALAAELFAFGDELSAESVLGHQQAVQSDERHRERTNERLAIALLDAAGATEAERLCRELGRPVPRTVTVLLPHPSALGRVATVGAAGALVVETQPDRWAVVIPDLSPAGRQHLAASLTSAKVVVGPTVQFGHGAVSLRIALRECDDHMGTPQQFIDTQRRLVHAALSADTEATGLLCRHTLAPLDPVPAAKRRVLEETLRWWLLQRGSRDAVAETMQIHPQTVGYRVAKLRELFAERLNDPEEVEAIMCALAYRHRSFT